MSFLTQAEYKSPYPFQKSFQEAVRNGDTIEIQRILEAREGKINVNLYDPEGQTALHQSCLDGNFELVKLLVKFGADIKLANRDGWSALHIAAFGGHSDIVWFLNINATSKSSHNFSPKSRQRQSLSPMYNSEQKNHYTFDATIH